VEQELKTYEKRTPRKREGKKKARGKRKNKKKEKPLQ
jgi:hypothetical protein